jgi:hypothetical protein
MRDHIQSFFLLDGVHYLIMYHKYDQSEVELRSELHTGDVARCTQSLWLCQLLRTCSGFMSQI